MALLCISLGASLSEAEAVGQTSEAKYRPTASASGCGLHGKPDKTL